MGALLLAYGFITSGYDVGLMYQGWPLFSAANELRPHTQGLLIFCSAVVIIGIPTRVDFKLNRLGKPYECYSLRYSLICYRAESGWL